MRRQTRWLEAMAWAAAGCAGAPVGDPDAVPYAEVSLTFRGST